MVLAYNPERTFIEVVGQDAEGYGAMAISMLDPDRQLPLLRYQTGDVARLLDGGRVAASFDHHDTPMPGLPPAFLALRGRAREALPNGSDVGVYRDALYANHGLARGFTGATRLIFSGESFTMHVQLAQGSEPSVQVERALLQEIPPAVRPSRLRSWSYRQFPFGMTLDYERKFKHYMVGEEAPE
jgi:phenylacetate-CoA ligase